jgi:hypothetical protein
MNKIAAMIAVLIGLSACQAGMGIGDYNQQPNSAATDAWVSALAQASIGTVSGD